MGILGLCWRLKLQSGLHGWSPKGHITIYEMLHALIGRLHQPGVRARAIEQYDSVAPGHHDDLTNHVFAVNSELRTSIDTMGDDGSGMSGDLEVVVKAIADIPLDDSIAESPHDIVKNTAPLSRIGQALGSIICSHVRQLQRHR